ncbi:MAG: PAS domain S-box protein [Cyclobacteriaceae bacterium]|jgi:PAS domain S-box-containing protein
MIDFTSFIEANQGSAIVTNSTGQILEINKRAEELLECTASEVVDKQAEDLFPVLTSFFGRMTGHARPKNTPALTGEYISPSGKEIILSIRANELKFEDQRYFWFILEKADSEEDEENLRDKNFYKKILSQSRDVILQLDSGNRIIYVSPSCFPLMGYEPAEILNEKKFNQFIYEEDRKQFDQVWKQSLRHRDKFLVNRFRITQKSGTPVWVEVHVEREYDNRGRLVQSIANLRNITDRINYQLELEKVRDRYQLAVEAGHNGIWDYSFKEKHLFVDNSLKSLLGYNPGDHFDEQFLRNRLIDPKDQNALRNAIEQYVKEGKSYFEETFKMIHKSRVSLWVLARGKIFYEDGLPDRIICSVTDITEKIDSNQRLRNALINFKAIFDAFPDQFFRINKLGDFLEVMAGESADHSTFNIKSFEGKNMKDAFPSDAYFSVYECLQRSFYNKRVELCEYELEENGKTNNYEARIIAIAENEAIGIVRNITDAVRTNMELVRARKTAEEALNAKEDFLSMMSHEIRTPLNVVIGMTYLLLEQDPNPDQLRLINTLKFSSDNLLRLINDLLDFSKIKAGKLVFENIDFNVKEFIWNIFESYKLQLDSSRVELTLDIDDKIPAYINGDYSRLTQILNNLLSNAQKFTDQGKIGIDLSLVSKKKDRVRIKFEVSDSGIGISPQKLDTIFEPFNQGEKDISRRYGGTGLGLAIVKQLIELLGGNISVSSEQDKGSRFTVELPFGVVDKDKIATKDEAFDNLTNEIQNLKILYAEDVSSNQFLMKGYADLWKFELDIASNGEEAINLFVENDYDVVLLDLQMPVMDGFQAAKRIREIEGITNKHTPILAVTGDISELTLKTLSSSGMNDYISKPINPKIMIEKIQEMLRLASKPAKINEPDDPEEECDTDQLINFSEVDYLYGEVPTQYIQLINLLLGEFSTYKTNMARSLKEENFDEFRQIRHSMRSNMRLLQMHRMESLVDKVRAEFVNSSLPPGGGFYVIEVDNCFDALLEQFEKKLKVLTT